VTCKEVADFIMEYLDDELEASQRVKFERHLKICRHCVRYFDSYKTTVLLGKSAAKTDHAEIPDALVEAILAARDPKP
jgi:anti-sigma factor RsiW